MTPKQEQFVAEYCKDLNATRAAKAAGYSEKTATEQGARLLTNVQVRAAIAERTAKQLEQADITAEQVKKRLAALAMVDPRKFFDEHGNLIPITKLDAETAACIAQFEVIVKNAQAGDGHTDIVHKVRLVDSTKPLNTLAEHFGLLVQKVEHSGNLKISWDDK